MLSVSFSTNWVSVSRAGFVLCFGLSFSLGCGSWCVSVGLSDVCCFRGGVGAVIVSGGLSWLAVGSCWSGGLRGWFVVCIVRVALFAWRLGSLDR